MRSGVIAEDDQDVRVVDEVLAEETVRGPPDIQKLAGTVVRAARIDILHVKRMDEIPHCPALCLDMAAMIIGSIVATKRST